MNSRYHVPALVRALEVIETLAKYGRKGVTLAALTETLGYPKNSIFRITATLSDLGYVARSADSYKFRLTKKILSYGLYSVTDENIVEQAIDVMRALRDSTGASAFLGVLNHADGMILEQAPGGHPFKLAVDPGTRFTLHSSAPGKALLAFLAEDERNKILRKIKFRKFTERTITSARAFRTELAHVRACGYAVDFAEEFEGIHCVGAPIFDYTNESVAALWISGAAVVLPAEKFKSSGAALLKAARQISERLGYLGTGT